LCIEKDWFEKSRNYCSTCDRTTKLNIQLEDLFPQKLSDVSFTDPTSTVGIQSINLWSLKVMLRCVNDGVTTVNPGHQTTGNARVMWSKDSSFTLFPALGRVYVWRTHREAYNPECLVPTMTQGGGSVLVWAAISWYIILLLPLLPFMPNYCKGVRRQLG
jgi:hypothetical protein